MSTDALRAFGWNINQILVYIWQGFSSGESEQDYPYERFANSDMGKRLRIELIALAAPASETEKLSMLGDAQPPMEVRVDQRVEAAHFTDPTSEMVFRSKWQKEEIRKAAPVHFGRLIGRRRWRN
jgi:hypothetical protein